MSEALNRIDIDKVIAHTQKAVDKISGFSDTILPQLRKAMFETETEVDVVRQIGVEVEQLPPAGAGEIQVGDGDGPRETPVFETVKEKVKVPFDLRDLLSVQPIQQPLGRAFALRSKSTD